MVTDTTPWYRQPWPWFLISLPASAVIAGSITFYIAASGWDGPVAADYYRQGLAINEEITRSKLGQDLGVAAVLQFSGLHQGQTVRVQLDADKPLPPEAALRVRLLHPGRKDADRLAVLSRLEVAPDGRSAVFAGQWQSELADQRVAARPVAWQVVVETQQWRLDGELAAAGGTDRFLLRLR